MARNMYDLTPSRVQLMRRQSTETYKLKVYAGNLSDEHPYVSVEAGKGSSADDVVGVVCRKLRLNNAMEQHELAEVFSSGGQLCKERRLGPNENPVALMLLWPKVESSLSSANNNNLPPPSSLSLSSSSPSSSPFSSSAATTASSSSSSSSRLSDPVSNSATGTVASSHSGHSRHSTGSDSNTVSSSNSVTGIISPTVDCYRFYLRIKDPEMPVGGWMVSEQSAVDSFLLAFLTQPLADREFPDLCSLPDLNEHTLLHNLMARFNQKNIYTYVGSILIAVNPFKFFPIYNPKYVSMYQNKSLGELPPHIFAVADAAYHSMLRHRKNQCIVISGESGSGKTESTNLLLHHLTALSQKGSHGSGVEQTILGAGPVLEAFGNAKTVHNNNSSRFGKFIQVNYKQNGMVHGAVMEKYLLEKSRIVFQAKNERNYHVFYYLLAGADPAEREALHLAKPDEYNYLSQSGCYSVEKVDEEHEFARLRQSMEMVGFSAETQRKIFSVLSAVLLLGNIEFKKKKGDQHHDESVTVKNEETVKTISSLLKVKEKYVLEALTQKKTTAGDETFIITYKMEDAIATRDAMAKCIYGALFDWIVLKVNQALLAKKHDSDHEGDSIGVLDIFGFEDFGRNSFEQFCINYANEHLQYYFNQHIFKFEQEEYQREGIQWKNIEFIDNTGSLELFYKRPSGLFCLLDEECNFPAATNETLLNKFTHHHKNNPHYQVPQLKEGAFSIKHYAGRVKYFIKDFREKNVDLVRPEIVATLKRSSLTFVRELMGIDPVAVLRWSVVRAFFRCYFAFIKAGEKFRTNDGKESRRRPSKRLSDASLQDSFSENLLNSGGPGGSAHLLLGCDSHLPRMEGENRQANFQYRDQVHQELLLYSLHDSDARIIRRARKLLMKNKSFKPRQRPCLSFRDIKALKAITGRTSQGSGRTSGSKKQPPTVGAQFQSSLYRLMKTLDQANPFFIRCIKSNKEKAPCVFDEALVMRQLRYTGMLATVKIRQSGYNYRLLFEEFIQLYKILLPRKKAHTKADIERFLQSMHLNHENYQIGINKVFLRESEKMHLDEALHTAIMHRVVTIQRWAKTCLDRRGFLRLKEAAVIVQKYIRRYLAQRDFQEYQLLQLQHCAAVLIQNHYRCYLARRGFLAQREAVVYIQSYVRAVLTRRKFFMLRDEYYAALAKEEADQKEQERLEREKLEQEEREQQAKLEAERLEREALEQLRREKEETRLAVVERIDFERNRERKEELQSTASDEGVLLKASSNEELEERDENEQAPLTRRDSEESGILEDSDSELPHTEPSSKPYMSLEQAPEVTLRGPARSPSRSPPKNNASVDSQDEELARLQRISKVQEMARKFQRTPEKDDSDGRIIIIRRGSQRWKHKKFAAPLAQQESFSDLDASPTRAEHNVVKQEGRGRPPPLEFPRSNPLTSDRKAELEGVISRHNAMIFKKEDTEYAADHNKTVTPEPSGHLSPLHKIKNLVTGGRRKAEASEEETEDVLSPSRRPFETIGISVLPQIIPLPTLPVAPHQKNDSKFKPDSSGQRRLRQKKKPPRADKSGASNANQGQQPSRSNIKITRSTEWQYPDNLIIDDIIELAMLDEFINNKSEQLYKDGPSNNMYTFFDRIFKGSLDKFRKDLKSTIALEAGKENAVVKYRDLFEQFRQLLEAEMKREHTGTTLLMNAFRGFLDEFRKQQEGRKKDNKRDEKRMEKWHAKKKKHDKAHDTIDFNGHHYLQIQFNIRTLCEVCSSFLWIMDKGYVCQVCKLACHKKCYSKLTNPCKGSAGKKHPSNLTFGVPLDSLVTETRIIPEICERLMSTIERTGLYTEGIYRKCGANPKIRELRAAIDANAAAVNLEEYHVHVLTAILKQFLRDMPEPLLSFDLYDDFLRCTEIKEEREKIKALFDVINKLPKANFNLLERLVFHLACVVMHSDSNKMSANALAVIFAPVLLRSKRNMQAQEAIHLMPKQMMCVEYVLKEEVQTVKSKYDDIDTLESAEKTAGERLNAVRASLRLARKSPLSSPVKQASVRRDDPLEEEELADDGGSEEEEDIQLQAEERALSRHLASIHKEKDKLTYKLPLLETRQASSDEDVLSGDELDNASDSLSINEEGAVNFSLPGFIAGRKIEVEATPPSLRHITKCRVPGAFSRRLPSRFGHSQGLAALSSVSEDDSEACLPEPEPTISIRSPDYSPYHDSVSMESSYIAVQGLIHFGDDDEIMV